MGHPHGVQELDAKIIYNGSISFTNMGISNAQVHGIIIDKRYLVAFLLVAAGVVAAYFWFSSAPDSTRVISGVKETRTSVTESSPVTQQCIKICNATVAVGIDINDGICLNNNINGYACAVVVADKGHCPAYYKGAGEIVLNENCEFVGLYRYGGGSE